MAFLNKALHLQTFYKAFSIGVCVRFFQEASDSKNLNNKHLKSTFCEGCKAVFLVNL